jgi:DNA-binding transcriptional regulator YdaS (Cro superfamily)
VTIDSVNYSTVTLEVELADSQGLYSLKRCLHAAHASPAQFARLMGVTPACMSMWLSGKRSLSPLAIRAAYWAAATSGVPVHMPKPSQYLATAAKASKKPQEG